MKHTYTLLWIISTCFLVRPVFSQDIQWEKSYGGKHADYLMDAIPTADYGFILAGSSLSNKTGNKSDNNLGDLDYWVWKMDENGEMGWQKSFGGPGSDMLQSIKNTQDGGFILAGVSNSSNHKKDKSFRNDKKDSCRGGNDFWIIKLDASGNEEWQKTIGGSGQEKLQSICQTKEGGYILGGSSSSDLTPAVSIDEKQNIGEKTENSFGNMDYWIVKLDKKGKIEWQKIIGGLYFDELRSIEQTVDRGFILGGYSNSPASGNKTDDNIGNGDYWVVKLDMKGEIEWQKTIGGSKDDYLYAIHQTYDKGYILGGNSNSGASNSKSRNNDNGTDFWVVKLDEKGAILWQETYNIGKVDVFTSLVENDDHTLLLGGFAQSESTATNKKDDEEINDYVGIKITEKGEEIWRKSVGSKGEDILKKVIETRDGGYLFAGTSNPAKARTGVVLNSSNGKNQSPVSVGNGATTNPLEDQTSEIKESVNELKDKANDFYNKNVNKAKEAAGLKEDSRLKFGIGSPLGSSGGDSNSIGSGGSSNPSGGMGSNGNQNAKLAPSRDKKTNYGSNDFWVVKLKDDTKPKVVKASIEAIPNPAATFTNVIVGYEFTNGTATVVDMAGRVLQQFKIDSRTVPVDLSNYPMGIYVINIETDVQSDGVKVMKGINKK